MMGLSETYRRAAAILAGKGWSHGMAIDRNGARCVTAAVNEAAGRAVDDQSVDLFAPLGAWLWQNRPEAMDHAFTQCGYRPYRGDRSHVRPHRAVQMWNDSTTGTGPSRVPVQTQESAIEMLRDAAASFEGTEPVAAQ